MTFQAYAREIDYWKRLDHDFIALGHANLNVAWLRASIKPETVIRSPRP